MRNPQSQTLVGLDLGGTQLKKYALSSKGGEEAWEVPWMDKSKDTIFRQLVKAIEPHLTSGSELSVGVAVPGFLSLDRKTIVRLSNLPELNGTDLIHELNTSLEESVEIHWSLDTDTNAGLWAESQQGPGKNYNRVFYVSLGTGLGGAMAIDGQIVRNANHTVGQIAHIPLGKNRLGAENLLSANGLMSRVSESLNSIVTTPSELAGLVEKNSVKAREAKSIFEDYGRDLGELLGILGNLFSPEIFILGGGLSRAFDQFQHNCEETFTSFLRPDLRDKIEIVRSHYDGFSGARGAALLNTIQT